MAKIPILNSDISEIFQGLSSMNTIYLLTNNEAKTIWIKNIDKSANSYFKLEDDSWLVRNEKYNIGDWLDSYNTGKYELVSKILNSVLGWRDEDRIYFCLSEVLSIESSWREFKLNWDKFIEIDDDCPIIINQSSNCEVIIFKPLGEISLLRKDSTENSSL